MLQTRPCASNSEEGSGVRAGSKYGSGSLSFNMLVGLRNMLNRAAYRWGRS